jgi:hypothetical protein
MYAIVEDSKSNGSVGAVETALSHASPTVYLKYLVTAALLRKQICTHK